jgi:multiple sugar transport system permease protein
MQGCRRRQVERALDSDAIWPLMVGLTAVYLAFFVGYPVIYNVIMSVQHVTLGNIRTIVRPFVGMENYSRLIADPLFLTVVQNTLLFTIGNVVLQFLGGFGLALFFQQPFPGAAFFRGLILSGWILPPLVIGAVWKWLLASDNGVINYALRGVGLISHPIYWLSDPATSLIGVTLANIWFGVPFNMILLAAGLAGIPGDIYEAAALDGAGPIRRFLAITLPLMRPTIYALLALSTIYTLRAFDLIWTMTHGGPVDASNIFPVWAYHLSFELFDFGGGAAVSSMMLAVVFVVALIYVRSVRAERLS